MASSTDETAIKKMVALAAVSEYAAALVARVDELESKADDDANTTAPSTLTMPTMPNLAPQPPWWQGMRTWPR